jgi:hypothetical protein
VCQTVEGRMINKLSIEKDSTPGNVLTFPYKELRKP